MSDPSSAGTPVVEWPSLDPRLVQWMAIQTLQDRHARLVDGGAEIDNRIDLSTIFIDLPVGHPQGSRSSTTAMPVLLGKPQPRPRRAGRPRGGDHRPRWLLVGGPGSGKSTLTTMVAQHLRAAWIERRADVLPVALHEPWKLTHDRLCQLARDQSWPEPTAVLPLRVNLPSLARWMATHHNAASLSLWDYLATRMVEALASREIPVELSGQQLRALIPQPTPIYWIFDGLDEVPATAGRRRMIDLVRGAVCDGSGPDDRLLIATRPQGYVGEFDDLELLTLTPLTPDLALNFAERLLGAWLGDISQFTECSERMRREFAQPEVAELLQTPLHTTMAAVLTAGGGLPKARSLLFEHYFHTILRRELGKPFDHGIQETDKNVILALHTRAGLTLHVRSQQQVGARSSLRRRELREMLAAIYRDLNVPPGDIPAYTDRLMRFAADRLVLLLHSSEGEYEFGVRSLQEYFAALGVMDGETSEVRARLESIVLDTHWSNVLAFVVSSSALATERYKQTRALVFTVSLCEALNAGTIGGPAAARCFMGSRLAIVMLQETEAYGYPWLHDPLWTIALSAATAPRQSTVGRIASNEDGTGAWTEGLEIHAQLARIAAEWTRSGTISPRKQALAAAEQFLSSNGDGRRLGWQLIIPSLRREFPDAIALAERCAPTTAEDAHLFVWSAFHYSCPLPSSVLAFIEHHPAWFPPSRIGRLIRGFPDSRTGLATSVIALFAALGKNISTLNMEWSNSDICTSSLNLIPAGDPSCLAVASQIPAAGSAWEIWRLVLGFLATPGPETLANIIDASMDESALAELRHAIEHLPWPLAACIKNIRTPEECRTLAAAIRAGCYGSLADWQAAETRWKSISVSEDDLDAWMSADGPWNADIATRGAIVLSWEASSTGGDEMFTWLTQWIERHPLVRATTLELWASFLSEAHGIPLSLARRFEDVRSLDGSLLFRDIVQILPLTGSDKDADEWFSLLDDRGRTARNTDITAEVHDFERYQYIEGITAKLIARLRERPDQWGLLDALSCVLRVVPDADLSVLQLPEPAEDSPRAHALRVFVELLAGRLPVAEFSESIAKLRTADHVLFERLVSTLQHRSEDAPNTIDLLLVILDATPQLSGTIRDAALGALFAVQRRSIRPSFASRNEWRAQKLPEPFFASDTPAPQPSQIKRVRELSNIRLFRETPIVDSPFPLPPADRGQWLVLVGENGAGKTTLLRALGLTLASPAIASKLLDERLPMLRNGGQGRITIEVDGGDLSIVLRRDDRTEVVDDHSSGDAIRPWVVGYGVRRGNARGEKDRDAEVGPIGEMHTLFDRPASLHNAVQWLRDLDADVLREQRRTAHRPNRALGPRERVWRSVVRALEVLLGVTKVEVDDGGTVHVQHPQFERVRLDALSDGYLTTAGWVIDMIARWVDRQQELDEPIGNHILRQMCGFVLLDEIDLHLHPMWQMRIIDDVRRLFPRLSFVVTTHSPLTLHGARSGEIYVIRRSTSAVELVQRDIRPGHDVDRVLFEQFGVAHTFDQGTRDLLQRHRDMLARGVDVHDPERLAVERQLHERFGEVAVDGRGQTDGSKLRPDERHLLTPLLKRTP